MALSSHILWALYMDERKLWGGWGDTFQVQFQIYCIMAWRKSRVNNGKPWETECGLPINTVTKQFRHCSVHHRVDILSLTTSNEVNSSASVNHYVHSEAEQDFMSFKDIKAPMCGI